jgi:hypothetical protein
VNLRGEVHELSRQRARHPGSVALLSRRVTARQLTLALSFREIVRRVGAVRDLENTALGVQRRRLANQFARGRREAGELLAEATPALSPKR